MFYQNNRLDPCSRDVRVQVDPVLLESRQSFGPYVHLLSFGRRIRLLGSFQLPYHFRDRL